MRQGRPLARCCRQSASASELVAACLQDHGRAKIVGMRSYGKGTVQNLIELENGRSALKLTTASYWRPSERNIHRRKDAKDEVTSTVTTTAGMRCTHGSDHRKTRLLSR